MDALRVAAPLSRLLLALSETGREGEVSVVQRMRTARLSIAGGRVVALSGVDLRPLGDTLLALGALDVTSQRSLLAQSDGTPVGARLVAAGATSSASVLRALELQLGHGIESLLQWPTSKLSLQRTSRTPGPGLAMVDLTSTVWSALLAITAGLPESAVEQLAGRTVLRLTPAGTRRVRGLLQAAESGALAAARARRAIFEPPTTAVDSIAVSEAALQRALAAKPQCAEPRLRALLRVLGAAVDQPAPEHSYALLLRKTREVARNASANVLLDLPPVASSVLVRQAFRRLAQKLHPDRFQAGDARLHALSHRVMGALAEAEHALRAPASA
ncbi:MAG: hypothetical protein JWN04_4865 [Myxococcaceae bacterium]|nr:hypothetical protein [Myxococcaceae bacterium]